MSAAGWTDPWSSLRNCIRPWLPRQIQFLSSGRRAGDCAPRSSVRRLCTRASCAGGRSNRGVVLPRDRIPGNGPRHGSPDIVDYAKGGISNWRDFLAPRPSFDRRSGSALVPGDRQTGIGEMSAAVVACILQRGAEFNSAGGYLRGLMRKSEVGVFSWPDPDGAD